MTSQTTETNTEKVSEKYYLLTELGQGGTAVVNAAIARGMGGFSKLVVLKQIKSEFREHQDAIGMFLNEARLSSRMNHPNVVQVYEVFEERGLPVIVMEYLEGQSLARILSRVCLAPIESGYSVEVIASIVYWALKGLHYAHTLSDFNGTPLGLIHRDATPHNVMVTYDGQVKLLDFGIAKLNVGGDQTQTGIVKGKLGYMPREQVDGSVVDCRADVFAMGVVLWEGIARRRLWKGAGDAQIVRNLICDEIPKLAEVVPDADPELCRICDRAMAPRPEQRYPTALELGADLERFLSSRGGVSSATTIAKLVDDSCGDLRASAKAALDEQLAQFSKRNRDSWKTVNSFSGVANSEKLTKPAAPLAGNDKDSNNSYLQASLTEAAHPKRTRIWPWLAVGFAALAVASVFGAQDQAPIRPSRGAIQVSSTMASPSPLPMAEAEPIAAPSRPRLTPPPELVEPPKPTDAPPKKRAVVPAKQRKKVASKRRRRKTRAKPVVLKKVPKEEPKKLLDCTPPYFIDNNGIKQYRRECL